MESRRVLDWALALVVCVTLLGVLAYYVLATNRLLASTQLTAAYHAMRTSILLVRAHCQVAEQTECVQLSAKGHIQVEAGYPAATHDGIVLASGLAANTYTMDYWPGGLFVYPAEQVGNPGCKIEYSGVGQVPQKPRLVVYTHDC